jgi:hypothetical protein
VGNGLVDAALNFAQQDLYGGGCVNGTEVLLNFVVGTGVGMLGLTGAAVAKGAEGVRAARGVVPLLFSVVGVPGIAATTATGLSRLGTYQTSYPAGFGAMLAGGLGKSVEEFMLAVEAPTMYAGLYGLVASVAVDAIAVGEWTLGAAVFEDRHGTNEHTWFWW